MNARKTAWDILYRVFYEGGYASLLMRRSLDDFSSEDRALISEIVYGTLRNRDMLELQWKRFAQGRVRPRTAVLLNMSVYQLRHMDRIPDYAVIDEAVNLAQKKEKAFVNAVLRKVKDAPVVHPSGNLLERTAVETSHPLFLLKLWSAQYGEETALAIAEHDQKPSQLYARRNPLKASKEELEHEGARFLEGDCFVFEGDLLRKSWLKEGKAIIQDRSSQKVVSFLDAKPGMKVLDVCAAPGTKTQQIACAMHNQGLIIAHDIYEERVHLIEELMERTGVTIVKASCHDGTVQLEGTEAFDRILIDAPCSGLGDLSHKPEIRFHVTPESLDELVKLQKRILETNAPYLKPGGILVYSTCTLNRKENELQVKQFLNSHREYSLVKESTFFPMTEDSDGFYAAAITRSL